MSKQLSPATEQLSKAGLDFTVHEYVHDPATASYGDEAVAGLGVDASRIFKTLVAKLDHGELVVAVVPVAHSLRLKALAAAAGTKKATMAEVAAAERSSGYVAGGISPFGQRKRLRTFLDDSARDAQTIFVSAGRRGVEVEVAPHAFVEALAAQWAPLTS